MEFVIGLVIGYMIGIGCLFAYIRWANKQPLTITLPTRRRPYPRHGERPDIRRIVLRPVNKDEPPSRVTQALFRQRPTRKLDEDD